MGAFASTMLAAQAPTMLPLACLDLLNCTRHDGEAVLWPTVLVRESPGDWPGAPRRITITARTAPLEAPPCR